MGRLIHSNTAEASLPPAPSVRLDEACIGHAHLKRSLRCLGRKTKSQVFCFEAALITTCLRSNLKQPSMHLPGGHLGEVTSPSNRARLDTHERAGKEPCDVCVQAVFRLSVSNQESFQRMQAVSASRGSGERIPQ